MEREEVYKKALEQVKCAGIYRTLPDLRLSGKWIDVEGRKLLNLNGNDYLGLLDMPELWSEFLEQAQHYAPSSASSRLLTGNDHVYSDFEAYLARVYARESALLWDSGYHANSGIIPVLALPKTLLLADRLVHASIIEGIRLSGASFQRFKHNDLSDLQRLLDRYSGEYETIWVITESLFSMDGDFAPLVELVALKQKYPHLYLYVDEAHAVGVYGEEGLGVASQLGLIHEIDVLVGTLGKALGSVGAYSLQSKTLRSLMVSQARPLIFSTALPPVMVAWSHFVMQKVAGMAGRRERLKGLVEILNRELGADFSSQIVPIVVPGEEAVTDKAREFVKAGFYVRPIRKPTVPEGSERLRLSLTAAMTEGEVREIARLIKG